MIRLKARARIEGVIDKASDPKKWVNELEVFTFDKTKRQRLIRKRKEASEQAAYLQLGQVLKVKSDD